MAIPARRDVSRHPIRVVALRTGLTADVLRVWERRYGVVEPGRGEGGQRLYSDADVERLALLQRATSAGRPISQVAPLGTRELQRLVSADDAALARRGATGAGEQRSIDGYLEAAWAAVAAVNPVRLEQVLRRSLIALGGAPWADQVLSPLLHRIGEGWEREELTPAHEHAATAVSRRVLDWLGSEAEGVPDAPTAVIATPAGERHELGAMLAAATAAAAGWQVLYLGADLPAADIAAAVRQRPARLVGLSVVTADGLARVIREITGLRKALAEEVVLVVGGRAASKLERAIREAGARVITDLAGFRELLSQLKER